jgi:hypothetical protein
VACSALGWLAAGILDLVGAFRLSDALVIVGLLLGVVSGFVAFQGSDTPLLRGRTPESMGMVRIGDNPATGALPSGQRALVLAGAIVAAVGLVAAGALTG